MRRFCTRAALAAALAFFSASTVISATPTPVVSYALPDPSSVSFSTTAVYGPNGLLYAYDGLNVLKEGAINGSTFSALSTSAVPAAGSDAGPIAFSRNGSTIYVGTGGGGFDFSGTSNGLYYSTSSTGGGFTQLPGSTLNQYYFTAVSGSSALANSNQLLAVDSGNASFTGSLVSYYDTVSGSAKVVVAGVNGASTNITYDDLGNLFVGVGYGSSQGEIRKFSSTALDAAYTSNTPLNFSAGALVNAANNNSGAGMFVDNGYLFVGSGSSGGFTVIAPDGTAQSYNLGADYASIIYNTFNGQFAVLETSYTTGVTSVNVFEASSFLPEPALGSMLLLTAGVLLRRRKAA